MGISKIVNSIILPLADNGVSLFCMSTYQGDFILVGIVKIKRVNFIRQTTPLIQFFKNSTKTGCVTSGLMHL